MRLFIILLGPPGSGKGTQAQIIAEKLNIPHISSGDIFRENLNNQTELGKIAESYIKQGELVPDDITVAMIRERLTCPDCLNGALLDGFPRTPIQAQALDQMIQETGGVIRAVMNINVTEEMLIERLSGRRTCRAQGHVFHVIYNPPKREGICDFDGSELYQREDDREETVRYRIRVYQEQTKPLIEYYRARGLLVEIDGSKSIDQVTQQMLVYLEEHR